MPDPTVPFPDYADDRLAALRELRGIGMAVARAVGRLAEAAASEAEDTPTVERPAARAGELSLAFARVSRAVRLTVALEARMETEAAAPVRAAAQAAEDAALTRARVRQRVVFERGEQLAEVVNDLIEEAADGDEEAEERLYEDFQERLDGLDDDELADRPLVALIARICCDLGLSPDWALWAGEDWVEDAGGLKAAKRVWAGAAEGAVVASPALEAKALSLPP